jgi:hypothetical protein
VFLCADIDCVASEIFLYQTCWTICFIANDFLVLCFKVKDILLVDIVSMYGIRRKP